MPINQIEGIRQEFTEGINLVHSKKKSTAKSLLNNAGILLGVFIVFSVIVIVTTDLKLADSEQLGKLGIDFFLLLFCSYSMYINCSDSGMKFGLQNKDYLIQVEKFESKKKEIICRKKQTRLHEFCRNYIKKELENTKTNILAVVGYDYETYIKNWSILTKEEIRLIPSLTKPQKDAIIRANAIMPVRLTPEMIMMRGRGNGKRAPLGINPTTKKKINFGIKFVTNLITALFWTSIVVDFVIEPTWRLFVAIVLRSLLIILNGYSGYKFGYENIVFDTTNYISDQTDLIDQALQYFEETPAVT